MTHTVTRPHTPVAATLVRDDHRGRFVEAINAGPWETVIAGTMKRGAVLGNHYHQRTRLFFFLLDGSATVTVVRVTSNERWATKVKACEGLYLEPGEAHAIRFTAKSTMMLLKSRPFDENDPDTFAHRVLGDADVAPSE